MNHEQWRSSGFNQTERHWPEHLREALHSVRVSLSLLPPDQLRGDGAGGAGPGLSVPSWGRTWPVLVSLSHPQSSHCSGCWPVFTIFLTFGLLTHFLTADDESSVKILMGTILFAIIVVVVFVVAIFFAYKAYKSIEEDRQIVNRVWFLTILKHWINFTFLQNHFWLCYDLT